MTKTNAIAASVLTLVMFASGYLVSFVVNVLAALFKVPGPYSESPVAWVWFVLSLLILFGMSMAFCVWFARIIEKKTRVESTFQ